MKTFVFVILGNFFAYCSTAAKTAETAYIQTEPPFTSVSSLSDNVQKPEEKRQLGKHHGEKHGAHHGGHKHHGEKHSTHHGEHHGEHKHHHHGSSAERYRQGKDYLSYYQDSWNRVAHPSHYRDNIYKHHGNPYEEMDFGDYRLVELSDEYIPGVQDLQLSPFETMKMLYQSADPYDPPPLLPSTDSLISHAQRKDGYNNVLSNPTGLQNVQPRFLKKYTTTKRRLSPVMLGRPSYNRNAYFNYNLPVIIQETQNTMGGNRGDNKHIRFPPSNPPTPYNQNDHNIPVNNTIRRLGKHEHSGGHHGHDHKKKKEDNMLLTLYPAHNDTLQYYSKGGQHAAHEISQTAPLTHNHQTYMKEYQHESGHKMHHGGASKNFFQGHQKSHGHSHKNKKKNKKTDQVFMLPQQKPNIVNMYNHYKMTPPSSYMKNSSSDDSSSSSSSSSESFDFYSVEYVPQVPNYHNEPEYVSVCTYGGKGTGCV